jgi:hypothetical protein
MLASCAFVLGGLGKARGDRYSDSDEELEEAGSDFAELVRRRSRGHVQKKSLF